MESLNIKLSLLYTVANGLFVTLIGSGNKMHGNQKQAPYERQLMIAYAAGLLDGEGSFSFMKNDQPNILAMTNRKSPVFNGVIRAGMTDVKPLEFLQTLFPDGILACEGVRKRNPTYKVMYRWSMTKRVPIISALKELIPFLIAKKPQAIVLLDALENWKNPFNRKLGMDPLELQRRNQAWLTLRKMNAVGAAATTKSQSIREDEAIV